MFTPSCVTVSVTPPIVSVPDRAAPEFGATEKVTVPLSTPAPADVTEMNASLLVAVHAQPVAVAVIVTVPVPPVTPKDSPVVLSVNAHETRRRTRSRRVFPEILTLCDVV